MDAAAPAGTKRYCCDCKHCLRHAGDGAEQALKASRCALTKSQAYQDQGIEYLSPDFTVPLRFCAQVRLDKDQCGPDADWFEPLTESERLVRAA
jgi:hypothetical protein